MRWLTVLILAVVLLSGCSTYLDQMLNDPPASPDYYSNLEGLSRTAIIRKFGQPASKQSSFSFHQRKDQWQYYFGTSRKMLVTFVDGHVSEVSYD